MHIGVTSLDYLHKAYLAHRQFPDTPAMRKAFLSGCIAIMKLNEEMRLELTVSNLSPEVQAQVLALFDNLHLEADRLVKTHQAVVIHYKPVYQVNPRGYYWRQFLRHLRS